MRNEQAFGVEHNLISLLMRKGHSEQEAMDRTGELMEKCQREWDDAIANLPSWGEEVDKEVRRYIDACSDVARANMHWSFKSGRYLNPEEGKKVRETRILDLPVMTAAAGGPSVKLAHRIRKVVSASPPKIMSPLFFLMFIVLLSR